MTSKENKPGYKKTKLGWIPKEWDVKRLQDLAKVTSGGTPSREKNEYWEPNEIPWITTSLINFNIISKAEQFISKSGLKNSSAKLFSKETILVGLYGQGVTRGKCAILGIEAATNQACAAILCDSINFKYLFYYLMINYENIRNLSNSGGQKNLSSTLIKQLKIPIPAKKEQQKIATILSTWDKAIDKLSALIDAKLEQKKGLMHKLLNPKDNWTETSYGRILKEVKRNFDWSDEVKYDLISVRRRSGGLFFRDSLYGHQIKTKNLRTANEGDFLISKMQILHGASGLTTKKFDGMKISGSYIAVVSNDDKQLDIRYFEWLSKTKRFYHQTYVSSYGVHIEKMTFNFKLFKKMKVMLPNLKDQRKAVSILNEANREIKILKRKMAELEIEKKGLMQQLLKGRKRVKV